VQKNKVESRQSKSRKISAAGILECAAALRATALQKTAARAMGNRPILASVCDLI